MAEITKKNKTGMLKRLKFKIIFPSVRERKSHENREIKTKNKSRACLLKSKTFAVPGKKNKGNKKTNKYILNFVILFKVFSISFNE